MTTNKFKFSDEKENTVGKEQNDANQHFVLFLKCIQSTKYKLKQIIRR